MKFLRIYGLLCCLLAILSVHAQDQHHTYVSDRKFMKAEDLFGYTFMPGEMEFSDNDRKSLDAGELSIYVTPQRLRIKGGGRDFEGDYSVVSTDEVKYGFLMKLMDARNPTEQGHLKFILDGNNNVDALIFKKSRDKPETILYQEKIDKNLDKREAAYFTDMGEITLETPDSIWGTVINPFLRISPRQQDRIESVDSVYIEFVEDLVIKTKEKKEEEVVEEIVTDNEPELEEEDDPFAEGNEDEDDSDPLAKMMKKKAKKEKPEKQPKEEEEEDDFEDDIDSEFPDEMAEDREDLEPIADEPKVKKEKEAKVKEKREFSIILRFNRWEEGERKEERLSYPVKSWRKLTSKDPNDAMARHMMEFSSKPNSILVFLDDNNTITKVEIGNVTYYMRGF